MHIVVSAYLCVGVSCALICISSCRVAHFLLSPLSCSALTSPRRTEMLIFVFILCGFTFCGLCVCERDTQISQQVEDRNAVFTEEQEANTFLGRHLLYNRFDFEIFTPGNLERECIEEVCNYEEAREVFENIPDTDTFWKQYTQGPQDKGQKIDVTALLVGLIAGGVAIIIVGLLVWYTCQNSCRNKPIRPRSRRSNASVIIRRLEEVSLHPIPAPPLSDDMEAHGLPSYEQAIAITGPHDAPPPPYPGSRPGTIRR
ncbi:transmembrane gamma-carboxyglutamic acid protein 4 isoform X1 [Hemibagrus wyckioides]|nr:transmembrane gamma-carboxyglutamic acid protein 4 isoform X1 [Hemibagrus wyckioides]